MEIDPNFFLKSTHKVTSGFFALKEACIHPSTQKPYIRSCIGGKDHSPEGLQVSHVPNPFLLLLGRDELTLSGVGTLSPPLSFELLLMLKVHARSMVSLMCLS